VSDFRPRFYAGLAYIEKSCGNPISFNRVACNLAYRVSLVKYTLDPGVQSAHGLLETNFGRTLRFRNHLRLLSQLDSFEGHIGRSGTRNNWFDCRGRRRDLCFAFTCFLGPGDNRVWRSILPVSGGLKHPPPALPCGVNECNRLISPTIMFIDSMTQRSEDFE
jgi:hypothetical protein